MHLIVGATGEVGRRVVRALLQAGEPVRAVSRDPARLGDAARRGAETVVGDLRRSDWQEAALAGVERVVIASHGLVPPSRSNTAGAVDGVGAQRLIDAAAQTGVRQVLFISLAGAEREATTFARIKRGTERHLEASGVPWTVLRPTVFPENHALLLMGEPLRAGKPVQLLGTGAVKINWISASDVADDVVWSLQDASALGSVRELRGRDHLSRLDVLALLERELGVRAKRQHLPLGAMTLMRMLARPFHPGLATLLELASDEERRGGDPPDEHERATWVGPTRVKDVIERWVAAVQPVGAS